MVVVVCSSHQDVQLVNSGHLTAVGGAMGTGKEGHIYYADHWKYVVVCAQGGCAWPHTLRSPYTDNSAHRLHGRHYGAACDHVCIKIFRTTLNEFTNRSHYVEVCS